MGELILLDERRALARGGRVGASGAHAEPTPQPVTFYFDLACPFSYLAAERVERLYGHVVWVPTAGVALHRGEEWGNRRALEAAIARAEERAAELRVPLVLPDRFPCETPMALRAASFAAEVGSGAAFALAASRLAFCGGFDLEDLEILAEAAAAAGIRPDVCLAAAADEARDGVLDATARGLLSRGVARLPALRVRCRWFAGERGLSEASFARREAPTLAPVG